MTFIGNIYILLESFYLMQKSEWTVAFIFFIFIYALTSFSTLPVPVFADNHTNVTNETHLECVNQACVLVNNTLNGTNADLCRTNTDCFNQTNVTFVRANRTLVLNLTHLECANQACVSVNGKGLDLCQSNAQCNLTNLTRMICVNQACVLVNVSGINGTVIDCATFLDCQNITNTTGGGGGNGSNGSNDFLPLAPPAESVKKESSTLARAFLNFIRSITGLLGLDL